MIRIPILWHVYLLLTERYGPPRYSNVYGKIVSCFMENREISVLSLVFLRLLSTQNLDSIHFLQKALNKLFHFAPVLIKGSVCIINNLATRDGFRAAEARVPGTPLLWEKIG